jgi:sec-independent protein translocase protein TatB
MVAPPPIQLASLGMADSIILMILALVVFGPRRLPQIGRQIGKLMFEFRKASNDFKFQMEEELRAAEEAERRKREDAERQRAAALAAQSQASVSAPAQTVESAADIGAVEPTAASSYPPEYPAEGTPGATEPVDVAPTIQPPSTGEQVSTSGRPELSEQPGSTLDDSAALADLNLDADVAANAEEFTGHQASGAAGQRAEAVPAVESTSSSSPDHPGEQALPPGPPKEPVSQHG